MSGEIAIGIDLGTTYSSISVYNTTSGQPETIKENGQTNAFASVVKIEKRGSNLIFISGNVAKNNPSPSSLYDSKRLIGKTYQEYEQMGSEKDSFSFEVHKDENNNCLMVVPNPLNENEIEKFYPEEVSALVLKDLIAKMKNIINISSFANVVVTVPVIYNPAQRKATLRACKLAGLNNVTLLNEPSASLIEYKRYIEYSPNPEVRKQSLKDGDIAFVIDFGGGTLDICCCKIIDIDGYDESVIEVLASDGDQDLGGNHFDEIIKNLILNKLDEIDSSLKSKLIIKGSDTQKMKRIKRNKMHKLMLECEKIKIELSSKQHVQISLEQFLGEEWIDEEIIISKDEFEEECEKELIPRFKKVIERFIKDSKIDIEEINLVLPIGGTCRIPIVRKIIEQIFTDDNNKLADRMFDSMTAVANGAAYHSYRLYDGEGESDLIEVLPYSIGIEVRINDENGWMYYLARKGDSLPSESYGKFLWRYDCGELVKYEIFVGESERTFHPGMRSLGEMIVSVPPIRLRSYFAMEAIMKISESGIVDFEVKKEIDGSHLGNLQVSLDMNELDSKLNEMMKHLKKFE